MEEAIYMALGAIIGIIVFVMESKIRRKSKLKKRREKMAFLTKIVGGGRFLRDRDVIQIIPFSIGDEGDIYKRADEVARKVADKKYKSYTVQKIVRKNTLGQDSAYGEMGAMQVFYSPDPDKGKKRL